MLIVVNIILLISIFNNSYQPITAEKLSRHDDLYSSVAALENVLKIEKLFYRNLQHFILQSKLDLKSLKVTIETLSKNTVMNQTTISSDIFNQLQNIQRNARKYLTQFNYFTTTYNSKIPTISDLNGAVLGLVRLQRIYGYTAEELANGNLSDTFQLPAKLTAYDCFIIAEQLNKLEIKNYAIDWYKATLHRINIGKRGSFEFQNKLDEIQIQHLIESMKNPINNTVLTDEEMGIQELELLQLACSGKLLKNSKESRQLYCKYEIENHKFLRIAPIKIEILNWSPYLVVFHDIIYDSEIELLKKLSFNDLERADTLNVITGTHSPTPFRISKHAWIENDRHPILHILNQRMSDMTGLSLETSEDLQIANYGIGGHYDLHYDYFEETNDTKFSKLKENDNEFKKGERIGTILFYLTTVPVGGATVWPYINVKINPVKGSAAFWYNLYPSLKSDDNTLHSSCPVVLGSKWAANKWIRSGAQIFNKPCLLNPLTHHIK